MKDRLPWILLVISVAVNAFFVGGYAYARMSAEETRAVHESGYGRAHGGAHGLAARLDLSAEQRDLFRQLREQRRDMFKSVRQRNAPIVEAYWDEMVKDDPDPAKLAALKEKRREAWRAVRGEAGELRLRFMKELSPEQRQSFAEMMKKRRGRHKFRR